MYFFKTLINTTTGAPTIAFAYSTIVYLFVFGNKFLFLSHTHDYNFIVILISLGVSY